MINENELFQIKKDIEQTKSKIDKLKGKETYLYQKLKDDWKCPNVERAISKIKKLKDEIREIQERIDAHLEDIEKQFKKDE